MKIQSQAIAGTIIGAVITVGAVLLFMPPKKDPFYSATRVDGNLLKTLYNSDFSTLVLNFKYNSGTSVFDLTPSATGAAGAAVAVDQRMVSPLSTGKTISGNRTLVPYSLQHNRVSGLLQLQTLVGIVDANPGCYFVLNPDDYAVQDPSDRTHVWYRIVAFNSANREIDVSSINRLAFQLNPSPPGRMY